jgi:4-alpha-glucanotransferase
VSNDPLHRLARRAGIIVDWIDAADKPQRVSNESLRRILSALDLPCETEREVALSLRDLSVETSSPELVTGEIDAPITLSGIRENHARLVLEDGMRRDVRLDISPGGDATLRVSQPGYHEVELRDRTIKLAVAPRRCWTLEDVGRGKKLWGLAVQLYGLQRPGDGGIGDTMALATLGKSAAAYGADAIAISPTHALFAAHPEKFGPYAPSNRLLLNPLLAGVDGLLDGCRAKLESAHDPLIDWPTATTRKMSFLRRLFESFCQRAADDELVRDFQTFRGASGSLLESHARFEAIHAHIIAHDPTNAGWRTWPQEFSSPDNPAVRAFAESHRHEVAFHAFLQWLADRAFGKAQAELRAAGMRIGLIADLAVGMESGGSYAWAHQHEALSSLTIGAPQDLFNPKGQNWGLTTFSPRALVEHDFEPFLATLRAALRHAGGIRIDHILGLKRLWVVPEGETSSQGAYLNYPFEDLLRLVRLESVRERAIVIGEDLGTVPEGFRHVLSENGIAGLDVLWFARDRKGFLDRCEWRHDAVAMTTTHDLPTLAGWWRGADIAFRAEQRLVANESEEEAARSAAREDLWRVFTAADIASTPPPSPERPTDVVDDAISFVAGSPSALVLLPLEDLLGLEAQPNVPGTVDEHPNWRRRYPVAAAEIFNDSQVVARAKMLGERDKS